MAPASTSPILRFRNFLWPVDSRSSNPLFFVRNSDQSGSLNSLSPSVFPASNQLNLLPKRQQSCSPIGKVSTAPVEYVAAEFDFEEEIARLHALRGALARCGSLVEKSRLIDTDSRVKSFMRSRGSCFARAGLSDYDMYLLKCVVGAGQEHVLGEYRRELYGGEVDTGSALKNALYALADMIGSSEVNTAGANDCLNDSEKQALRALLKTLGEVERFYDCVGGIIGYQIKVLELLAQSTVEGTNWSSRQTSKSLKSQVVEIHPPSVRNLAEDGEYASQAALWGIEGLPDLGEIYPLGGSADRLGLVDPETSQCLPAAMLPYCGRTLLEGLIRDLQAREFLYFKLFGKQCITPVAIMTSSAKNNHRHISCLCERLRWFGRGQSSFQLFEQPLVPTVAAEDGKWIAARPFEPVCKPGGHGVIWKLAHDKGIFKWFQSHARKGATVRQISNVVAATDLTLLALAGIGLRHGKKLGFASCKRNSGATEGINVLLEKKNSDRKWSYGLTCIEYTEFDKFGITDHPLLATSLQADFPANTNILYVDLPSVALVGSSKNERSLPGMVLNIKKPITYVDHFGMEHSVSGGRLECTMQNIADNFSNTFPSRCYEEVEDGLDTFIVYNKRRKVTSSAKKNRRQADKSMHQTPDGSLLDIMRNAYDILSQCGISIPKIEGNQEYVTSGPPYLILLHPALGPIWEVIRQKFVGGSIARGSELQVEIAEFQWKNVQLDGSLIVLAENAVGSAKPNEYGEPILQYGSRCGRCKLENVKVINNGIDWNSSDNLYWKHDVKRFEALKVILHGNAEFEATDVVIHGNYIFDVPDGHKLKITSGGVSGFDMLLKRMEDELMDSGTWYWSYKLVGTHIELELVQL